MAEFIDTHAHLDAEQFRADLPDVLARARSAGVVHVLCVATTAEDSARSVALAEHEPMLSATAGLHPNNLATLGPTDWDTVVAFAASGRVVALGETGLDRHWDDTPFPVQEEYFARHLDLARTHQLPVVIHCREAEPDVLRLLRADFDRHGPVRGVLHSFTGSAATAEVCLAMGLFISFAGMVTYKNAADLRAVARTIPDDRILLETDCPYLSPVPLRGKRNEPANIVHTASCLAAERGVDLDRFAEQTTRNARTLFGFKRQM